MRHMDGPAWVKAGITLPLADGVLVGPRLPGHRRIRRTVSASFWTEYGKCPTAAKLSRIDKIEPEYVHRALDVGRLYHDVFGAFWTADSGAVTSSPECYADPYGAADLCIDAWWHSQRDRLEAAEPGEANYDVPKLDFEAGLVRAMLKAWARLPRLSVAALEVPFRVAIPGPTGRDIGLDVHGVFDALVFDDGRIMPWELKGSRGSIADYESEIDGNPQATIYGYAAGQIFGSSSTGVVWDCVAKTLPSTPKMLVCKKGPCSKRRAEIGTARSRLREIETDVFGLDADAEPLRALLPTPRSIEPGLVPWGLTAPTVPMDGAPDCAVCGGSGVIGLSVADTSSTHELVVLAVETLCQFSPAGREAADSGEFRPLFDAATRSAERFAVRFTRHPAREQLADLPGELRALDASWRWNQKTGIFPRSRGNCRQIGRTCQFLPICPPYGPEAFDGFRTKE